MRARCLVRMTGRTFPHEIGEVIELDERLYQTHLAAGNVEPVPAPVPVASPAPPEAAAPVDPGPYLGPAPFTAEPPAPPVTTRRKRERY